MIELLGCGGEKDMVSIMTRNLGGCSMLYYMGIAGLHNVVAGVTCDGEDVRVGGCYRKSVVGVLARDLWWCSMLGLRDALPKSLDDLGLLMGWLQDWGVRLEL